MNSCLQCGAETTNPKFCGRSCAATYNNTRHPKRAPENTCVDCGTPIATRRTRCRPCNGEWQSLRVLGDATTLSEAILRQSKSIDKHGKASTFAFIRARARAIIKREGTTACEWCGYDKHVEVCHEPAISSYSLDTLVSDINKRENLLVLCRNCHWEHDKLGRRHA